MAINPVILQSKANVYNPDVRLNETDLVGYDGDPSLANPANSIGEAALSAASVGSFYHDSSGNLYIKTSSGWATLSATESTLENFATVYQVEVLEPVGGGAGITKPDNDPGIIRVTTEATSLRLHLAWDRQTLNNLAFSSVTPTIGGDPILPENITTPDLYAKVQTGFIDVVVDQAPADPADNDVEISLGDDSYIFEIRTAAKPIATYSYTLPVLTWTVGVTDVVQTSVKTGTIISTQVDTVDQEIDQLRVISGGLDTDAIAATVEFDVAMLDTDPAGTASGDVTAAIATLGTKNLTFQVRSKLGQVWSDPEVLTVEGDPRSPETSVVRTYPADQVSIREGQSVQIDGTVNYYDEISFAPVTEVDLSIPAFSSNDVAKTWLITPSMVASLAKQYRYEDVTIGTITYRSYNNTEVTYDVTFKAADQNVQLVNTAVVQSRFGEPVDLVLTFDQPPINYTSVTVENGVVPVSHTVDVDAKTITVRLQRSASVVPAEVDVVVTGMTGPSKMLVPVDITSTDAVVFNGFVQQEVTIPSGIRSGSIPIKVDLANYPGSFTVSWDGTGTTALTAVFDPLKKGTVTADREIYLEENPDGTLYFEIIFSDTTILQTTMRIEQQ